MIVVEFLLQQKNIRDDALHYIGAIYNDFPLLRLAHRDTFYVTVQNTHDTHIMRHNFVFKIQFEIQDLLSLHYFFLFGRYRTHFFVSVDIETDTKMVFLFWRKTVSVVH